LEAENKSLVLTEEKNGNSILARANNKLGYNKKKIKALQWRKNIISVLGTGSWIRIWIGSKFNDFANPDLGSKKMKKKFAF
jgi:hypothetical protein